MSIEQVVNVVDIDIHKLPYIENLYEQVKEKMQRTRQGLANDIEALKYKISILDRIAFSSEQDCKRTKQQVQELIDQKDKIEKLIAKVLNNDEGYSKLQQFVKENVKAVLSDNKILMSLSFAALIQTIKADPEMVKLIQNIPSANDGEQYKGNNDNNNIIKYLEFNKDSLSDLAERHYENLVDALTNNVISSAAASSLNPTLLLSQSSSTFSNPYDQSDTYRIEEPEIYDTDDDNKGDIAS